MYFLALKVTQDEINLAEKKLEDSMEQVSAIMHKLVVADVSDKGFTFAFHCVKLCGFTRYHNLTQRVARCFL